MKQPKISIIVPIYKAEDTIRRLLDSFINQPCRNIEFFLIDNASPDKCGEICKEYVEKDERFVLHTLEDNIGYIRARQYGIENCAGEFFGFADSDDYVPEDIYDRIIFEIEENDADFVTCGYNTINGTQITTFNLPIPEGAYKGKELKEKVVPLFFGFCKDYEYIRGFMWKNFYKKSIAFDYAIGFIEDLKPYEDQIYNIVFILRCESVVLFNTPVYNYIYNENSITGINTRQFNVFDEYRRIKMLFDEANMRDKDSDYKDLISNRALMNLYSIVYNAVCSGLKKDIALLNKQIDNDIVDYIKKFSTPPLLKLKIAKFLISFRKLTILYRLLGLLLKMRG